MWFLFSLTKKKEPCLIKVPDSMLTEGVIKDYIFFFFFFCIKTYLMDRLLYFPKYWDIATDKRGYPHNILLISR